MLINKKILSSSAGQGLLRGGGYLDLNDPAINHTNHPLVAWYDFTDPSTIYSSIGTPGTLVNADGQSIAQITNKAEPRSELVSRLAADLQQSTGASQPTFNIDTTLQMSYGSFDGSGDFLLANKATGNANGDDSLTAITPQATDMTAFWVVKPDSGAPSDDEYVFSVMDSAQSTFGAFVESDDAGWSYILNDNVARVSRTHDSSVSSSTQIQAWMHVATSGNACKLHKNGLVTGIGNGSSLTYTYNLDDDDADCSIAIGAKVNAGSTIVSGSHWAGRIYEVIIFDGTIVNSSLQAVIINYLLKKYRLTILT